MIKSNGIIETTDTAYYVCTPEREINPKAILHITREHRDELAEFLTSHGIIVCGVDNDTVYSQHLMYEFMRKKYRALPYILFGHGIGSVTARSYMKSSNYGNEIDGVILSDIIVNIGLIDSIKSIFKFKDKMYREVAKKDWASDIPLSLPVYVVGSQEVYDQLTDAELNDVTLSLTESHDDILNFINRVYDGIIEMKTL